jgi:hypothetical protein
LRSKPQSVPAADGSGDEYDAFLQATRLPLQMNAAVGASGLKLVRCPRLFEWYV